MRKIILLLSVLWLSACNQSAEQPRQDTGRPNLPEAKPFTAPKLPEDALKSFREAVKARDYTVAAAYCGGDYAELLKKSAPAARELGLTIDSLERSFPNADLKSEQVMWVLRRLDPLPPTLGFKEVKHKGEDWATVEIFEDPVLKLPSHMTHGNWNADALMMRTLVTGWSSPMTVDLKREKMSQGWKLIFPVNPELNRTADRLIDKHSSYVRALENTRKENEKQPFTKATDLELRLKKEIEGAK